VRLSFVIRLSKHEYCECRRQRLRFHERRELGQMERRTHHRLEEGKDRGRDCLGGAPCWDFSPSTLLFSKCHLIEYAVGNTAPVTCQIFENFAFYRFFCGGWAGVDENDPNFTNSTTHFDRFRAQQVSSLESNGVCFHADLF
jgi:hypothetical protein